MIRKKFLLNQRRMSYKSLNDRRRQAALGPILENFNQLPGLLFSIAIPKSTPTIFAKGPTEHLASDPAFDGWRPGPIERAMRIVHFASTLVRGLSCAGQDVWWFTDQDEIAANDDRLGLFVTLFATIASHYLPHTLRHLRISTTRSDTGRRDIEDLVSVADLAAGALQEALDGGNAGLLVENPSIFLPSGQPLSRKARHIMDWFADNTRPLRRLTLVIDAPLVDGLRVTALRFHGSRDVDIREP
ncbi:MAG: hypothetical protein KDA55_20605, partial [Planctomycetales bacterium]|nr:hypothetical protein [Planctomycetales bacterium]